MRRCIIFLDFRPNYNRWGRPLRFLERVIYLRRMLDEILREEYALTRNTNVSVVDVLVFAFLTAAGLLSRLVLFPYESGDYTAFLSGWFNILRAAGGLRGIGLSIGDYTPPYIYILSLLTYLPMRDLYLIKLISVLFDFLLAVFLMQAAFTFRRSRKDAVAVYAAALFVPTLLCNSAFWAQCDSVFTALLIMCVYFFFRDRPFAAVLCFSLSLAFKLQAVFLAPFLLAMWLKGRMRLRHFGLIPAAYLASILPAWIMGRPLSELLTIYLGQTERYSRICLNAPNIWYFLNEDRSVTLSSAALLICGAAAAVALYLLYLKEFPLTSERILLIALFFALLLPSLLPHMHERYFYPADALAILYGFSRPKRLHIPLMVIFASTASYLPFLFGHAPIDLRLASLVMFSALLLTARDLFLLPPPESAGVQP